MAALLGELFAQEAEFTPDRSRQVAGLTMLLEAPQSARLLVAEQDGKVLGMVALLYSVSTALGARVAMLEDFVITASHRSGGLGQRLLAFAIECARADGAERITLLTDHDNSGAQRLYERNGFARSSMVAYRKLLPRTVRV